MTYDHKGAVRDLCLNFIATNAVPGDVLEFGVFDGRGLRKIIEKCDEIEQSWLSLSIGHETIRWLDRARVLRRRFIGFDSFQGVSAPTEMDGALMQEGDLACPLSVVQENLRYIWCNKERVQLVAGWFSDTLKPELRGALNLERAALIHLDCDLYEPSLQALDWCAPLIHDNTVVILDDYFLFGGHPDRGQRRAWEEWLLTHREFRVTELVRNGPVAFVMHRREQP